MSHGGATEVLHIKDESIAQTATALDSLGTEHSAVKSSRSNMPEEDSFALSNAGNESSQHSSQFSTSRISATPKSSDIDTESVTNGFKGAERDKQVDVVTPRFPDNQPTKVSPRSAIQSVHFAHSAEAARSESPVVVQSIEFDLVDVDEPSKSSQLAVPQHSSAAQASVVKSETVVSVTGSVSPRDEPQILLPHPPIAPRQNKPPRRPVKETSRAPSQNTSVPDERPVSKTRVTTGGRRSVEPPLTAEQMLAVKYKELHNLLTQPSNTSAWQAQRMEQMIHDYMGGRHRDVRVQVDPDADSHPRLLRRAQKQETVLRPAVEVEKQQMFESVSYPSPNAKLRPRRRNKSRRRPAREAAGDAENLNKRSDHYLGHSDNPAVRKWLRSKNRELRMQRRAERRKVHEETLLEQFQLAEAERRKQASEEAYNRWLFELSQRGKQNGKDAASVENATSAVAVLTLDSVQQSDSAAAIAVGQSTATPNRPLSAASASANVSRVARSRSGTVAAAQTPLVNHQRSLTESVIAHATLSFDEWVQRKNTQAAKQKQETVRKLAQKQAAVDPQLAKLLPDLIKKRHEERDAQRRRVDSGLTRTPDVQTVELQPEEAQLSNPYAIALKEVMKADATASASASASTRPASGRKSAAETSRDRRVDAITHERQNPFADVLAPWERPATRQVASEEQRQDEQLSSRTLASSRSQRAKMPLESSSTRPNGHGFESADCPAAVEPPLAFVRPPSISSSEDESILEDNELQHAAEDD